MSTPSTMIPLTVLATTICEDGSCGCGCGLPLVELSLPQAVAAPVAPTICEDGSCGCGCGLPLMPVETQLAES